LTKKVARIKITPEGAFWLAKAIRGRFRYQRHFTMKMDDMFAVTFFPAGIKNLLDNIEYYVVINNYYVVIFKIIYTK
jgi:hypothetical protein